MIQIRTIGQIHAAENGFIIRINSEFRAGLINLEGFSHIQIIWWGNLFDTPEYRARISMDKPYTKGPDKIGVFATRSQIRPNPILITTVYVQELDLENNTIVTPYIDAEDGTPVLDIKPYHLSERVKQCQVPDWCKHWPGWYEDSAAFNWQDEFNF